MSGNLFRKEHCGYTANGEPAPVNYRISKGIIGSYDGLVLRPQGGSTWRKPPSNAPLINPNEPVFVPQGTPLPLRHEERPVMLPKDSMFIFSRNMAHPACCSATHSTSTGCVCTNKQQRDLIGVFRGGNKTWCSDPDF